MGIFDYNTSWQVPTKVALVQRLCDETVKEVESYDSPLPLPAAEPRDHILDKLHRHTGAEGKIGSNRQVVPAVVGFLPETEGSSSNRWNAVVRWWELRVSAIADPLDFSGKAEKWWFSKGNPLISGKPRLVKNYNLARFVDLNASGTIFDADVVCL